MNEWNEFGLYSFMVIPNNLKLGKISVFTKQEHYLTL